MDISLDRIWVLVCTILVFLMQAGFLCLEAGFCRRQHMTLMALKHITDWCLISLSFYLVGFGLMFGPTLGGLIGLPPAPADQGLGPAFFLFMLAFAATATAMISGAMAERTSFVAYLCLAATVSLVIYPIYGHWVWGNLLLPGNPAWLAKIGFYDFAGSSVVHVLGGSVALVGIWQVGPRLGRFLPDGSVRGFTPANLPLACLGVVLLWLGWWGFNAGSLFHYQAGAGASIILKTNLCGAAGAISALLHCLWRQQGRELPAKFIGGALGGLVASTACANLASEQGILLLGLAVGPVHNSAWALMQRLRLDDPVGVVPAHAICGILGSLAVPLLGAEDMLPAGSRLAQFGAQVLGLGVCVLWSAGVAWLLFRLLHATVGLRVSPQAELEGQLPGTPLPVAAIDDKE